MIDKHECKKNDRKPEKKQNRWPWEGVCLYVFVGVFPGFVFYCIIFCVLVSVLCVVYLVLFVLCVFLFRRQPTTSLRRGCRLLWLRCCVFCCFSLLAGFMCSYCHWFGICFICYIEIRAGYCLLVFSRGFPYMTRRKQTFPLPAAGGLRRSGGLGF